MKPAVDRHRWKGAGGHRQSRGGVEGHAQRRLMWIAEPRLGFTKNACDQGTQLRSLDPLPMRLVVQPPNHRLLRLLAPASALESRPCAPETARVLAWDREGGRRLSLDTQTIRARRYTPSASSSRSAPSRAIATSTSMSSEAVRPPGITRRSGCGHGRLHHGRVNRPLRAPARRGRRHLQPRLRSHHINADPRAVA